MSMSTDFTHVSWAGPVAAWAVNALTWALGGMSPLAALGALAALWWTIERALTERAKRRAISDFAATQPEHLQRTLSAIKTKPGEF
jgi:hypothetical protein